MAAIEFSLVARGNRARAANLAATEVVMPRLVADESWSVDVAGYNFRHEFALGDHVPEDPARRRIELCYVFTSTDGQKSIVRFDLKFLKPGLALRG
jgi:hypothetical protein